MSEATIRPEDIRWRVSNTWGPDDKKMGMLVGYVDARTVMDALDERDTEWSAVHGTPIVVGSELIGVPLALTVNGVTRSDVGMPSSQEPIKGAYSDALKRAAVHFGIGRELYELPKIAVECEVKQGKVKGPKALPTYRKGRWEIDRQFGWVKYEREPEDQPQDGERTPGVRRTGSQSATTRPAASRSPEEQTLLDELVALPGMTTARLSLLADAVGVAKGERATADQLREMLARTIESPAGVPSSSVEGEAGAETPASPTTPPSDSSGSEAATVQAPATRTVEPAPALPDPDALLDAAVAITGGEIIPPKARTVEEAIADAEKRAKKKVPA